MKIVKKIGEILIIDENNKQEILKTSQSSVNFN